MKVKSKLFAVTLSMLLLSGCQQLTSTQSNQNSVVEEESVMTEVEKTESVTLDTSIEESSVEESSMSSSNIESESESESELESESETSTSESVVEESDESEEIVETEETVTQSTEESDTEESDTEESYPFGVPAENLGVASFYNGGMNIPNNVTLDANAGTLSYHISPEETVTFAASVEQGPTVDIRVLSADGSGIRNVQVNTQVIVGEVLSNPQGRELAGPVYVFYNNNGSLSLVTPNFAGNVTSEEADVMLEYVQ